MPMHVVLVCPEIPQNTGNIARTCAATGATLHLVGPLGFSLEDRYLKRAGLDYWPLVETHLYESLADFERQWATGSSWYLSTKAPRTFTEARFSPEDFLVFGRETAGLPEDLLYRKEDRCLRIPMRAEARSLNLGNSVAVVLYEALRQTGYAGLSGVGKMAGSL